MCSYHNGVWGLYGSEQISITEVYGTTLLALRGDGKGSLISRKKRHVTLEWPHTRRRDPTHFTKYYNERITHTDTV